MFEILEKNIDELFARRHELQEVLKMIDSGLYDENNEIDLEWLEGCQCELLPKEQQKNFLTITFDVVENTKKELELIEKNIAYKLDKKYKKQIDKQTKEEAKKQKELETKRKQDQEIEEIAKNDLCIELELETAFENVMNDEAYTIEKQLENDLPF